MKNVSIVVLVVAVTASAWTFLAAQTGAAKKFPGPPVPISATAVPVSAGPTSAPPSPPAPGAAEGPGSSTPLNPLQQRFIDLSAKMARLMSEEQLQQAVGAMERDVESLKAWSKVEESARLLREVVAKHPHTKAAEAARTALGVIEQARSGHSPAPADPGLPERVFDRQRLEPIPRKNRFDAPPADTPNLQPGPKSPPNV